MAQVSHAQLTPQTWKLIWEHFLKTLSTITNDQDQHIFLTGLLTPTEKTMLAKRLMATLLIQSNWSVVVIAEALNMSTSTLYKIQAQYQADSSYQQLLNKLYPKRIPFDPSAPPSSFLKDMISEIFTSKAERYRQIKKL